MDHLLLQLGLVAAAVAAIAMSPFGRRTLREVGREGLMLTHARHLVHVMIAVALLAVAAAAMNVR